MIALVRGDSGVAWWIAGGVSLGLACSAPNPAFDGGGDDGASAASASASTSGGPSSSVGSLDGVPTADATAGDTASDTGSGLDEPPWWDESYAYRRRLTVTNHAAVTLPGGYSVVATGFDHKQLVESGRLRDDAMDLRIVLHAGLEAGELHRRILHRAIDGTAHLWFQTREPIEQQDTRYYVYYGNPDPPTKPLDLWADSMAGTSAVYLAADDFEDTPLGQCPDGWEVCEGWEVVAQGMSKALFSTLTHDYILAGDPSWTSVYVEARVRSDDPGGCPGLASRVLDEATLVFSGYGCTDETLPEMPDANVSVWSQTEGDYALMLWGDAPYDTQWHTVAVGWWDGHVRLFSDGVDMGTAEATNLVPEAGRVGLFSTYGTGMYADEIIVRRYVEPEPTVNVGPEEQVP